MPYDFLKFFLNIFLNIEIVLIHHYQYDPKLFLQEQRKIKQKLPINKNSVKNNNIVLLILYIVILYWHIIVIKVLIKNRC